MATPKAAGTGRTRWLLAAVAVALVCWTVLWVAVGLGQSRVARQLRCANAVGFLTALDHAHQQAAVGDGATLGETIGALQDDALGLGNSDPAATSAASTAVDRLHALNTLDASGLPRAYGQLRHDPAIREVDAVARRDAASCHLPAADIERS